MSDAPSAQNRLPDFYIIGAAKCGTTTLYKELEADGRIFFCSPKEPCFFDSDVAWDKGIDWYHSLFADATAGQLCGEASTNYTRWPQVEAVPERIHQYSPDAKLIYIMRDPVKRAHSHYVHRWTKETHRHKPFTMGVREYIEQDPMCFDSGRYCDQIEQYLRYFPRDQVLLLVFEDMLADQQACLHRVYEFLGLQWQEPQQQDLKSENVSADFRYHLKRHQMMEKYKALKFMRNFTKLLPKSTRDFLYNKVVDKLPGYKSIDAGFEPVPLSEGDRQWLVELYRPHNQRLSQQFGIDVSRWQN
ncbi:sulfotransferase family protein [Halioxenophilus aromaticivorans]|uniref:Sulfotransferase domain-containing protein n=1 Tax=Halioxenophilus aromaticivorans TaxID=1306992 RepID=A0AAV3U0X9_9ALTE